MKGENIVFIAGGIGLAPVRCVIWNALDLRDQFKGVTIIYGARSVADLVYKRELQEWAGRSDVKLCQCVDPGGETPDWKGEICFVPSLVEKAAPSAKDSYAVVCGPPIVIRLTLPMLEKMGFAPERIYTTLEKRMKCGLGKCGRCNVGPFYVCKDGPVFTSEQLKTLPPEY
jgi:sulfhydrogenase subunit gamma (sulfur reductase)